MTKGTGRAARGERGAALITALLLTTLLLAAGGALILTTAIGASTAADSTAEMEAYYAAEAGLEASLAVLRHNIASNPAGTAATFRSVVCGTADTDCKNDGGDLSLWLPYSGGVVEIEDTNSTYSVTVRDASAGVGDDLPDSPYVPRYLVVTSTGRGSKGAVKVLEMILDDYGFDFTTHAAVVLHSNDTNTAMPTFAIGQSNPHLWDGNDNAKLAADLPAFAVTNSADYDGGDGLNNGTKGKAEDAINGDKDNVIGSSQLTKLGVSDLEWWLKDADSARTFLSLMRDKAADAGRLNPTDYGSDDEPKFSFIDGSVSLTGGSDSGAGLMIVTGTYDNGGSSNFNGIILALGDGVVTRNGNPDIFGAMVVAKFQHTYNAATKTYTGAGGFTGPSLTTDGGGNSLVGYDSEWVRKAMETLGARPTGIVEK